MSMENRRLGQSDRGGGTKKKRRARHLIGLTLAGCVALGVGSELTRVVADDYNAISTRARQLLAAIRKAREA